VLSLADGHVRELVPQLVGGVFDRYDLSFDGKRVVFGYRRPKPEGFRLYEVGVDGHGLRQVTHPPKDEDDRIAKYGQTSAGESWYGAMAYKFWTDDLHPCYLPEGGTCFASTRCEHGVLCTPGHYLACTNLFRINADGTGLRPLSHGALNEYTPTMMEDGRILYNRWEYVYKGIAAVQPLWVMRPDGSGTVEYLRVMEQVPKPWAAELDPLRGESRLADGFGGHIAVSHNAHIWIAVLRGIVPVEEDGSACFTAPAGRNLFFQALDEDFMEVQRMRTFINLQPGESRSCIGCHEHRTQAPVSRLAKAFGRPPVGLAPQPAEVAPRPLHYPSDVQPILDRHCVSCHNGKDPKSPPDLGAEMTKMFCRSYESIMQGGYVSTIREWAGATYAMQHAEAAPPYTYGSHRSRLIEILKAGHHDVKLSEEEWIKLVTWIDCGAPYYGSYFGRRNLVYQGQPDFRPVPTIKSACGIPPEFAELKKPDELPAKLLAWWPLADETDGKAADISGHGRHGKIVGGRWHSQGENVRELAFDGNGYVSAGGLGKHAAVSVSLWVKPTSLPNRWNPLLFSNGADRGAFHFSLLENGLPNLAVNSGPQQWTHRRASTPLKTDQWRHVVVTSDPRIGGRIQFFVDGKRDGHGSLSLGVPLDLSSFRFGGWSSWEKAPTMGFHGALRHVRVYSGLLDEDQVAEIFAAGRANDGKD